MQMSNLKCDRHNQIPKIWNVEENKLIQVI